MQQHWGRKPLNMPSANSQQLPTLSPDELAWLATLEDVESRLVFTERKKGETTYRVEHGPFADAELQELPAKDWTLLVHDVEKHLPDFRAYYDLAGFIPDWRIDDLMISFAAPGGSVGPHQDNYDVFLCQVSGTRTWQLGERDTGRPAKNDGPLSLLEEFTDHSPTVANAGDVLYLPARVPHWGVANTACLTYSLGMRAPTRAELCRRLPNQVESSGGLDACNQDPDLAAESTGLDACYQVPELAEESTGLDAYYQDPDLALEESIPGLISGAAIVRARSLLENPGALTDGDIAIALGLNATEPKSWLVPSLVENSEAHNICSGLGVSKDLAVHGMAKLAYCHAAGVCQVFANGFCRPVSAQQLALFGKLCANRMLFSDMLQHMLTKRKDKELLVWLIENGVFDL